MKKITSLQEEVRKVVKKNPVEHEAITCLLVLLFIDESRYDFKIRFLPF